MKIVRNISGEKPVSTKSCKHQTHKMVEHT